VIIHCREAHEATTAAIREFPGVRGVMHCYTMGPAELEPYLDAGFHISFSGIVTFPKSEANRAAATEVPLERLLVETDCPFLAPQGHRGKRNEPAFARVVLEHIAEARGLEPVELAQATSRNANELFDLESR
jgi:TatD DNase family protein